MAWLIVLIDRLEAERERCRRDCCLTQTIISQKRALDTAWVELDRSAQEQRMHDANPDALAWRRFDKTLRKG